MNSRVPALLRLRATGGCHRPSANVWTNLLRPAEGNSDSSSPDDMPGSAPAVLLKLRDNPGRPSVTSMQTELAKLDLIRRIELPVEIGARAERKVERELLDDLKRVIGKQNLLFELSKGKRESMS